MWIRFFQAISIESILIRKLFGSSIRGWQDSGALDMSASEENAQDGAAPSGTAGYMNSALQDIWHIYICMQDESG